MKMPAQVKTRALVKLKNLTDLFLPRFEQLQFLHQVIG